MCVCVGTSPFFHIYYSFRFTLPLFFTFASLHRRKKQTKKGEMYLEKKEKKRSSTTKTDAFCHRLHPLPSTPSQRSCRRPPACFVANRRTKIFFFFTLRKFPSPENGVAPSVSGFWWVKSCRRVGRDIFEKTPPIRGAQKKKREKSSWIYVKVLRQTFILLSLFTRCFVCRCFMYVSV